MVLSGVEISRVATGAAGAETVCLSVFIRVAGGLSLAPLWLEGVTATSLEFPMSFLAPGFTCPHSVILSRMSDSEGSVVPEAGTSDPCANRLDLPGSSICDGMFLRCYEGPGTSRHWSYIRYYLSCRDLCPGSVSILTTLSCTVITPAPEGARVAPFSSAWHHSSWSIHSFTSGSCISGVAY